VFLIALLYYVFAVMATQLFGEDFPHLFGNLGDSLFTLFTVMTLEGWTNDVAKPVMEKYPYAWVFFVTYIVVTTFMVLNLFIGVVVNAMQEEASKADAAERKAEREMIQEEAAPILAEVKNLRAEVAALRTELAGRVQT
jgi:voltage-gated sodium channel